jgi:superfamily II DNA/RNA helicase
VLCGACVCLNSCPNHLEEYVHRVGRTGRAGKKGTAYTFITPDEDQYAPILVKVRERLPPWRFIT